MALLYGLGVKENDEEVMKWMQSAAEKGLADAQALLGALFLKMAPTIKQ